MQSNGDDKSNSKADQEPYWRALDNKTDKKPSGRLLDLAAKFDFDATKDSDSDDVDVRIGSEDFQFAQKKMEEEFYVSPKDVIHDALFYLSLQDKKSKEDMARFRQEVTDTFQKLVEESKADGTYGTPAFDAKFNALCEEDREPCLGKVYDDETEAED